MNEDDEDEEEQEREMSDVGVYTPSIFHQRVANSTYIAP